MKSVVITDIDDQVVEQVIDALICRLSAYQRQNHSLTPLYENAIKSIKIVDENGEITDFKPL